MPVVEQVMTKANGTAEFSVSRTGALAYVAGGIGTAGIATPRMLVWVDRHGREEVIPAPPRAYLFPRLSPDGTRVALDVRDQESDIWTWDFAHATLARLTSDPAVDNFPVWTPDAKRIIFSSARAGPLALYSQAADGTGHVEPLLKHPTPLAPSAMAPDGKQLVVRDYAAVGYDLSLVHLDGTPRIEPLIHTPFIEDNAAISPDGRWLAYQSNESSQNEIYVRPFPNVEGGRWLVSSGGGQQPVWARNGSELFYIDPNALALMAVAVQTGSSFSSSPATKLFDTQQYYSAPGRPYDISLDGQKFLMLKLVPSPAEKMAPANITVVLNWFAELKARVAPK
jgi:serine/threonine-protein kinase